jgi:O-methyltransferase
MVALCGIVQPVHQSSQLYLDLLKRCLTRTIFADEDYNEVVLERSGWQRVPARLLAAAARKTKVRLIHADPPRLESRLLGRDWPQHGETMVGITRLDNLQICVETVLADSVPGDLIETGVWRGGSCILMKAVLAANGDSTRRVWVADSFAGLPRPNADKYPADKGVDLWKHDRLAVSVDNVKLNFERYGLLDEQVQFLVGWFSDTLAQAPISQLAVLRLDGDLYESTMDALVALYPKLSPGGFVIVDDYNIPACQKAIDDYRAEHGIVDEILPIDGWAVYWRRAR